MCEVRGLRSKRSASHATQIRIDLRKFGFGPERGSSSAFARAFPRIKSLRRRTGIEPAWELSPPHRF
jgi:hypothetical protein